MMVKMRYSDKKVHSSIYVHSEIIVIYILKIYIEIKKSELICFNNLWLVIFLPPGLFNFSTDYPILVRTLIIKKIMASYP